MAAKTGTYTLINSTTLVSSSATVTFSSIPATYTDLVLVLFINNSGGASQQVNIRVNGDTGSNYSETLTSGNGSTVSSGRRSSVTQWDTGYQGSTSNGINIVQFNDYSNTTTYKTVLSRGNNAGGETSMNVHLWSSTSAINEIRIYTNSTAFSSGTNFKLYGIEAGNL